MMNYNRHNTYRGTFTQRGFTLVETLVAITVLLVSVAGPLTIASQSLVSARSVRDQITAVYLAQEAIEIIRNARDRNALVGSEWMAGIGGPCGGATGCGVDASKSSINISACGSGCGPIQYDENTGLYGYNQSGGEDSIYTRIVKVDSIPGQDEVEVIATVSWQSRLISKQITMRENLSDWQQ